MRVKKQAAAAQGVGIKGVPGARFGAANAANLPLRLIRRTTPRKGPAAFSFPPEPNRARGGKDALLAPSRSSCQRDN
jgi:hypothetical protein